MARPQNDRIEQIKKGVNELKQELEELLKDEAKRDRLRSLPLYSSKSTNYLFYYSPCWDKAYLLDQERRKKERTN
jgi:hypothetical protein